MTLLVGASSGCPDKDDGESASEPSSASGSSTTMGGDSSSDPGPTTMGGDSSSEPGTTTMGGDSTTMGGDSSSDPEPTTMGGDSSSDPGESETMGGESLVCPCIADDDQSDPGSGDRGCGGGPCPSQPLCGESLCPVVEVDPAGIHGCTTFNGEILVEPAVVDCALTALRDRTPGVVRWTCHPAEIGSQFTRDGYILIGDDGTAIRREWTNANGYFDAGPAVRGELPAPDVFTECLALESASDRYGCLTDTYLASEIEVCDEGWELGG